MIAIAFLVPSSFIIFPTTQSTSAFPTSNPLPTEYIFYDDFETDLGNWTTSGSPAISTTQHYHGAKSVLFPNTAATHEIKHAFNGAYLTNVVVEAVFRDNGDSAAISEFIITNATTDVRMGLRTGDPLNTYDYLITGGTHYQSNIVRSVGWHDFKFYLEAGKVRGYIDNYLVFESTLTTPTYMKWTQNSGGPMEAYVDQFIYYRIHQDALWTRVNLGYPVIDHNLTWKSTGVVEPSVIYEGGVWKMWYRGFNATDAVLGYSTSPDGLNYTDQGYVTTLNFGWCPNVKKIDGTYYLIWSSGAGGPTPAFYRKTSADGITWSAAVSILVNGSAAAWDGVPGNNEFWKEGSTWYMIYEAKGVVSGGWRLGLATSSDGLTWTKYAGNPVFGNASGDSAGGPYIQKYDGVYYMSYHYSQVDGTVTDIGMVQSTDLITWTKSTFYTQLAREQTIANEAKQVADPFIISAGGKNLLYFEGVTTGGTVSHMYVASSLYTYEQIAKGQVRQWGKQWIGDIGVTNNITGGVGSRTYWYSGINAFKGSYFYDWNVTTTSDVNITITSKDVTDLRWIANPGNGNPTVTLTIPGMEVGRIYRVYIDGTFSHLLTVTGIESFSYSGPWSEHHFEVIGTSVTGSISPLVNLIFIVLAVGIVTGVMVESVRTLRKEQIPKVDTLINMMIYIVIGLALLGAAYMTVT